MRASLHILTRDRPEALAVLLTSLIHQTFKDFDIVILDNSRNIKVNQHFLSKAILGRLQMEGHRINIVETPEEHRDIGKYRNQVIEADNFKNPIGIRIDDDSLLDPKYIEIVMGGFDVSNKLYSLNERITEEGFREIAISGGICPYLFYPRSYILQPAKFNEITENFEWVDYCVNFVRFIEDDGTDKHYSKTYFPSGHIRSNYAYRMDIAKKIKFPEWSGATGFTEETIFCIKAWMNGYKVIINPQAIAWHFNYPAGGGRDKVKSQQQLDEIKKTNLERLNAELTLYRKSLGIEPRGYP